MALVDKWRTKLTPESLTDTVDYGVKFLGLSERSGSLELNGSWKTTVMAIDPGEDFARFLQNYDRNRSATRYIVE